MANVTITLKLPRLVRDLLFRDLIDRSEKKFKKADFIDHLLAFMMGVAACMVLGLIAAGAIALGLTNSFYAFGAVFGFWFIGRIMMYAIERPNPTVD